MIGIGPVVGLAFDPIPNPERLTPNPYHHAPRFYPY